MPSLVSRLVQAYACFLYAGRLNNVQKQLIIVTDMYRGTSRIKGRLPSSPYLVTMPFSGCRH